MTKLAKIAITTDSDLVLEQALEKINTNNIGGKITKTELASYFLIKIAKELSDSLVEEIRFAHFKQVSYLEGLLKSLKQSRRDVLSAEEMATLQGAIRKKRSLRNKTPTQE